MSNLTDFLPVGGNPTIGSTQTSNYIDYSGGLTGNGTTISIDANFIKLTSTHNGTDAGIFQLGNGSYVGHEITFLFDESGSTHPNGQAMVFYTRHNGGTKTTATVNHNDGIARLMWLGSGWSYCNDWTG